VAGLQAVALAVRQTAGVRISAKADYAVRALAELAATETGRPVKGEVLATRQGIPLNFLENILRELRHAGIIRTQRGAEGGYLLARPASEITLAEILRGVEGPLAAVQGTRPDQLEYGGAAESLVEVWIAVRANLRAVLEKVTLADLAKGTLPASVRRLTADPEAWESH
jgi:Rrf2 family protein